MTKAQIKKTIDEAKAAIADKRGRRAKYSPTLKRAILSATKVIGPTRFARESGLTSCLISRWKRQLSRDEKLMLPKPSLAPGVRELVVSRDIVPLYSDRRPGFAFIKAGSKLEIEVPLEFLTPDWVLKVIGALNSGDEVIHV